MCLEVPEEVVPKNEDDDDEEQYGKRPRLSLIPPRSMSQDGKRNKGTYTCLTSLLSGSQGSSHRCLMVKEPT